MMKIFLITLEDDALEWFYDCITKDISCLLGLIKSFCKIWDLGYVEGSHTKYVMIDIFHRMRRDLDDLVLAYTIDPSNLLFYKTKDKYNALNSLITIVEKYLKSS